MITRPRTSYRDRVPNQPKTPNHSIRITDRKWEGFDVVAKAQDSDRTGWVDQFMGWVLHEPGVELPERLPLNELAALLTAAAASAPTENAVQRRKRQAIQDAAERVMQQIRSLSQLDD